MHVSLIVDVETVEHQVALAAQVWIEQSCR